MEGEAAITRCNLNQIGEEALFADGFRVGGATERSLEDVQRG